MGTCRITVRVALRYGNQIGVLIIGPNNVTLLPFVCLLIIIRDTVPVPRTVPYHALEALKKIVDYCANFFCFCQFTEFNQAY